MKKNLTLLIILLTTVLACKNKQAGLIHSVEDVYVKNKINGTFLLYDENQSHLFSIKPDLQYTNLTPASTFKIPNTLIGLDVGILKSENQLFTWDKVQRNPKWNKDLTLKEAYKVSAVWYYQELARKIGKQRMVRYLKKFGYGNQNTGQYVDSFWLDGSLKISPLHQMHFLRKLKNKKLGLKPKTYEVAKKVMVDSTGGYFTIYAKTGWGMQKNKDIGWFIGYVETKGNTYYFVHCIEKNSALFKTEKDFDHFGNLRKNIVYKILKEKSII